MCSLYFFTFINKIRLVDKQKVSNIELNVFVSLI